MPGVVAEFLYDERPQFRTHIRQRRHRQLLQIGRTIYLVQVLHFVSQYMLFTILLPKGSQRYNIYLKYANKISFFNLYIAIPMIFLVIPLPNTSSFQSRNKDGKKTAKGRQRDGNETKEKAAKKQCPFGDACAPAC